MQKCFYQIISSRSFEIRICIFIFRWLVYAGTDRKRTEIIRNVCYHHVSFQQSIAYYNYNHTYLGKPVSGRYWEEYRGNCKKATHDIYYSIQVAVLIKRFSGSTNYGLVR